MHKARAGAGGRIVTEEAGHLGLGGDVDDALVGCVVDSNVIPLVRIEVLEHVVGRRRSLIVGVEPGLHGGDDSGTGEARPP